MPHLNIEIKATCTELATVRAILLSHQARFEGIDHQIDTYFNTPKGRLKLREGNIENNLIHYLRDSEAGPKKSEVTLCPAIPGSGLKEALTRALGIKVVVDKQREIYFIENVKFHLDTVAGLGTFVEIEAIASAPNLEKDQLELQCQYYLQLLNISPETLIAVSYSDMLMTATGKGA